jgi:hypothetical protein
MANSDARIGLRPITQGNAGGTTGKVRPYYIGSGGVALYINDPVVKTGTSNTAAAGLGKQYAAGTLQVVTKATAGATNYTTGVVVGFENVDPNNLDKGYNPASTERVVLVADDPHQEFEIQTDSGAVIAATDIGSNADYIFTHGGDTATGLSGVELDTADMSAGATAQLAILGLIPRENNALGTNANVRVRINLHTEANTVVGI